MVSQSKLILLFIKLVLLFIENIDLFLANAPFIPLNMC